MSYVKVYKYKQQVSYDQGETWEDTGEYAPSGDPIGYYDTYEECIAQYRTIQSGTTCVGVDKHNQDVYEVSYDNGATWSVVSTSAGTLIEANSEDCGYSARTVSTGTTCVGVDKYQLIENQESYDYGVTWITISSSTGSLIETNSYDCGYRTRQTSGTPYCTGYDKYIDIYSQVSTDYGSTWATTATTPTLIEADSPDCGYVPPTPTSAKYVLTLNNSSTVSAECDSTSAITSGEVSTQYSGSVVSAKIGECVTSINHDAFERCSGLTSVTIPDSVTTIGYDAFARCSGLTSVTLPVNLTSIADSVFAYCSSLTGITMPDSATYFGSWAFGDCTNLKEITIPSGVTNIKYGAFYNCTSLSSVTIPDSVTIIGGVNISANGAFENCTSLTSITIPTGVTYIGDYTFKDCRNLKRLNSNTDGVFNIPSGVTKICSGAFQNCSKLTNIEIPSGVTSIDMYAFDGCSGLTIITVNATTPPTLGNSAFDNTNNCPIYVPCASVDAYKAAWSNYASRIQGIPPCGQPTFDEKYKLTLNDSSTVTAACDSTSAITKNELSAYSASVVSVVVGECVRSIGDYAFFHCSGLTTVDIPNSVTTIGMDAFFKCSGLTSCTIGSGVTNIGSGVFDGCTSLTSINIPSGITNIGNYAFRNCSGLTSVNIPSGVTSIGKYAFEDCISLTSVTIPNSVTSIGSDTFAECTGLTSCTIGSGVTSIGDYAFYGCSGLTGVTVEAVTPPTLGYDVFYDTNNCPIYVPASSVNAYKSASGWSAYASRIQAIP